MHSDFFGYLDAFERNRDVAHMRFDAIPMESIERIQKTDTFEDRVERMEPVIFEAQASLSTFPAPRVDRWYKLRIVEKDGIPARRYSANNNDGEDSSIMIEPMDGRTTQFRDLHRMVSLDGLADSTQDDLVKLLTPIKYGRHLAVYEVGQGSCSAVLDKNLVPMLYFDLGGGCFGNASTYPTNFRPCFTSTPPVLLSHWDIDHWISGDKFSDAQNSPWIVPRQSFGPFHMKFAQKLLSNNKLHIWPNSLRSLNTPFGVIYKMPSCSNRNHSGLILVANVGHINNKILVLCPGDAKYAKIPVCATGNIDGLIVTHHGGLYHGDNPPVAKNASSCIAYSYGSNNTYGHPHARTVTKHQKYGWTMRRDSISGNQTIPILVSIPSNPLCNLNFCSLKIVQ